jgi:hypothetical protein
MEQQDQQEQVEISKEEFQAWIGDKITKLVVQQLVGIREQAKDYIASGATVAKDADVSTDRMVGRLEGLTELFNLFSETKEATEEAPEYGH